MDLEDKILEQGRQVEHMKIQDAYLNLNFR